MTSRTVLTESAAKVNLGLEIPGKRADGYHEIRTLIARVSLVDTLYLGTDATALPRSATIPGVERNLVDTAIHRFREHSVGAPPLSWSLAKRIPVAAGLGGASSNAASALDAANRLTEEALDRADLMRIAGQIGSDVPFFLGSPVALASGRGTELEPIAMRSLDLLLIVPDIQIPAKTATLYSLLTAADFSDGSIVDETARWLAESRAIDRRHLPNAFARALGAIDPRIGRLEHLLDDLGLLWALSGAGPTHYALLPRAHHHDATVELRTAFGDWLTFHSVTTVSTLTTDIATRVDGD